MSQRKPTFWILVVIAAAIGGLSLQSAYALDPSECTGTTANGSLINGWQLPSSGENFRSYSGLGNLLGRTYVHSTVHEIVLTAYRELETTAPNKVFVYGETGKKTGGEFKPHKTHRNGLSVDFMVPLVDSDAASVPMTTNILNKWGYDLEFDRKGQLDGLRIDPEAMAEHIYQLDQAAKRLGVGIWRVIFDPSLQPLLHSSARWPYLRDNIQFSVKRSWVRHDDHYHVDFRVPCR